MVAATLADVGGARAWAVDRGREAGLGEDDLFALEIVVAEALTNVVRHAYGGQPPDRDGEDIALTLRVADGRLQVLVRDWGEKFELAADAGDIDLDELRTGGYGLYILKELMDDVTADTSHDEGTELRMERRIGVDRG
jgi:serine/threonine-protein kinase RsbW